MTCAPRAIGAKVFEDALGVAAVLELLSEWVMLKGDYLFVAVFGTTNVSSCLPQLDFVK
jgi:hypothetical protein